MMKDVLSIKELLNLRDSQQILLPDNKEPLLSEVGRVADTAIEYYQKYWLLRNGLKDLQRYDIDYDGVAVPDMAGDYADYQDIIKLILFQPTEK